MNEIMQLLLSHRSIRSFQNKEVDESQLDGIIRAVQAAPSWINGQQVSVISIKDSVRKKKFAELCGGQKHIEEAPIFLIFCTDFYRAYLSGQIENNPIQISDNIDILMVGSTDVGIALEAAITASESYGLGTVAIGGIRRNLSEVIQILELPPYVLPISGLCIGHPAEVPELKPRLPKEAVYHSETYNKEVHHLLVEYNQTYSDYLQKRTNGKSNSTWTKAVSNFYSKPYYQGIEEALKQQKFPHTKEE